MNAHPIHAQDADVGCRWLCMSAGQRTPRDNAEIARALDHLPFKGEPYPASLFPDPAAFLELIR